LPVSGGHVLDGKFRHVSATRRHFSRLGRLENSRKLPAGGDG